MTAKISNTKRVRKIPSSRPENCHSMSSEQFLKFLLGVDIEEWELEDIEAAVENEVKGMGHGIMISSKDPEALLRALS